MHTPTVTRMLALAGMMALGACSTLRNNYEKVSSEAVAPVSNTPSTQYVETEQKLHAEGHSGFRLLTLSTNALMSRLALTEQAEKSLDLQYYLFSDDKTGKLVAEHLLRAADRGVRVRLLLDDMTQGDAARMFDALDAHPYIEVRVFNPFKTRNPGVMSKAAQMLMDFRRLNRRMHNKSFISDNKVAIVGGRNIADNYFDAAGDGNFRDLDVVAIGPVVQEASRVFDSYWNDEATVPVSAFKSSGKGAEELPQLRKDLEAHVTKLAASDYAQTLLEELPDGATADRKGEWFWGNAALVADQPEKIEAGDDKPGLRIGPALFKLMDEAKSQISILSPYFIPSEENEQLFISLAKRGVAVRILTNSLASTDQPPVHGGYSEHRRDLLQGGVELYELKPVSGVKQSSAQNTRAADVALHAKSFTVDQRYVFVGSMNMDHRSQLLNTEMGLVVDSPELAKAVDDYFKLVTLPANAYKLGLENGNGQIIWQTTEGGQPVVLKQEPQVGLLKQTGMLLMKLLPIDSLL